MEHAVRTGDDRLEMIDGEIDLDQREPAVLGQIGEIRLLEGAEVVVGERVDAYNLVAGGQGRLRHLRADKARTACDDKAHGGEP